MTGRASLEGLRLSVWMALGGAWVVILMNLITESTTAQIRGVQLGTAFIMVILFAVVERRRRRSEQSMDLQQWLIVFTVVGAVLTLDYEGIQTGGLIINVSPMVALVLALLGRRS